MTQKKSTKTNAIPTRLIAPCGMNCRLCMAYTREKNVCPGCRGDDSVKQISILSCRIKNCDRIKSGKAKFCIGCEKLPCARLKQLDKRYRTKYGMSMIENLKSIETSGIRNFIRGEKQKWTCPQCGELVCVHKPQCLTCGRKWR